MWTTVSLLGAVAWGVLAPARGEEISAVWLVVAALGSYAIAVDFHPTNRRVLLGHHFAGLVGADS